jgi:hypothetical protein
VTRTHPRLKKKGRFHPRSRRRHILTPNYSNHQSIPPYASGPSRVAFQRARVANGELAAAARRGS